VFKGPASEALSANVREVRDARKLSQAELAARMTDLGRSTQATAIAKLEGGDRRVDVDELVILSAALNVSLARLLAGADPDPDALVSLLPGIAVDARHAWDWATGLGPIGPQESLRDKTKQLWEFIDEQPEWRRSYESDPLIQATRELERALVPLTGGRAGSAKTRRLRVDVARAKLADVNARLSEIELEEA